MGGDLKGRVILLNGASSAGKSSIGRALQTLLPDPWFLVPVDAISGMRSRGNAPPLDDTEVATTLTQTRLGYHRVVAALASVGNNVIMDYPLSEPWRVDDLIKVLEGFDATLVEVRCSPTELDRRIGLAMSQAGVYVHAEFDVAVDTTNASPDTCARAIADALDSVPKPKAFERLRQRASNRA